MPRRGHVPGILEVGSVHENHKKLLQELERILREEWDPIGVNDDPAARDEYDCYALGVMSCLVKGGTAHDVAEFLYNRQTERMELRTPPPEHSLRVAKLCVAAHAALANSGP